MYLYMEESVLVRAGGFIWSGLEVGIVGIWPAKGRLRLVGAIWWLWMELEVGELEALCGEVK